MCKLINEAALEQDSHALGWLLNIQNKGQEALGRILTCNIMPCGLQADKVQTWILAQ